MFKVNQGESKNIQQRMLESEIEHDRQTTAMNQATTDDIYLQQQQEQESLTKWQQSLLDEIDLAIHSLKREVINDDGEWVSQEEWTGRYKEVKGKQVPIYRKMKPMMNARGVALFRSAISPAISRNLIMSNYKENFIYDRLKGIVFAFISQLAYHYKDYDIDVGDLSHIVSIYKTTIEPTFFRCLNAGERQANREMRKVVEAYSYGQPQQKKPKGLFGGWM